MTRFLLTILSNGHAVIYVSTGQVRYIGSLNGARQAQARLIAESKD